MPYLVGLLRWYSCTRSTNKKALCSFNIFSFQNIYRIFIHIWSNTVKAYLKGQDSIQIYEPEMAITVGNLPLPRWYSKKCFEFHFCDCLKLELLVIIHQIHRVLECYICGYWNSVQIQGFMRCLKKQSCCCRDSILKKSPALRWLFQKSAPMDLWYERITLT